MNHQVPTLGRRALTLLTTVLALGFVLLGAGPASAVTAVGPQDAVGPHASSIQAPVGLSGDVSAGQGRVSTTVYGRFVVATGVAANTARATADDVAEAACAGGSCGIPGGFCFVAGTLILAEDGLKPIEEIEVGDKVWTRNIETGEDELREVDETYIREAPELLRLTIAGAVLTTTADHPFWVEGKGWTEAGDLVVGDVLATPDGTVALQASEFEHRSSTVYNFRVPGVHNYYALAGDTPVLVHNANYPSITSQIKKAGLPRSGPIRFVPPRGEQVLRRGPGNGYIDRFGNEWVKGPSRTQGEPYEWDVQLGRGATSGLVDMTRDGSHANVSLGGWITHK